MNLPASASKNDVLYRQFLDWRKKHAHWRRALPDICA